MLLDTKLDMEVQNINLDYYNRMEELQEKLKKSEEERMLLQRQFDLLLQANQEKERVRVSAVEARYRRFLDEDKRRRDRNSSLLQALDRIDSRTASLAAKTERMRMLRKHYEAFIAHAYPAWHLQMERPYCPLAPLPAVPRLLDVPGYTSETLLRPSDLSDYSETRYHDLPAKTYPTLATPFSRSELTIGSREDCPVVGRSYHRKGSAAIRSKSLSPTRVRDTSTRYEEDKITSPRNFSSYSLNQGYDVELSPRFRNESIIQRAYESVNLPKSPRFHNNSLGIQNTDKYFSPQKASFNGHHSFDYDRVNSDIEADQNTSGDLLNLSNLSLSDDGILEADISDTPRSDLTRKTFNSPRDLLEVRRSNFATPPLAQVSPRSNFSPRESYISRVSERYSQSPLSDYVPKPILSPKSRKADLPTSLAISDSVHRILLSPQDTEMRRLDYSVSPRAHKPTWQTLRPSYLQPSRSSVRRTVTFTEPEYGASDSSKYLWREDDSDPVLGSFSSLRRHSPSVNPSNWELTDHERYLREKQGREKDAFQEKIQRLKNLIQENKDHETGTNNRIQDISEKIPLRKTQKNEDQRVRWEETDNSHSRSKTLPSLDLTENVVGNLKGLQSRRSSLLKNSILGPQSSCPSLKASHRSTVAALDSGDEALHDTDNEASYESMSDKEQLSGQFMEKDEDVRESINEKDGMEQLEFKTKEKFSDDNKFPSSRLELNRDFSNHSSPPLEEHKTNFSFDKHQSNFDLDNDEDQKPYSSQITDQMSIQRDQDADYTYLRDNSEKVTDYNIHRDMPLDHDSSKDYHLQQDSLPSQDNVTNYQIRQEEQPQAEQQHNFSFRDQEPVQEQFKYGFHDQQSEQEPRANYSFPQEQKPTQDQIIDHSFQQDPTPSKGIESSYLQDQPPQQPQDSDYSYQNKPESPLKLEGNYQYEENPQTTQSNELQYHQEPPQQWTSSEGDNKLGQNQNVSFGQDGSNTEFRHPNSGDYTSAQSQPNNAYEQGNTFESYTADPHPDQQPTYDTYLQSPTQKEFSGASGYESYRDDTQNQAKTPENYQGYTGSAEQYPKDFQNYPEDQYGQKQSQGYTATQGSEEYQLREDPNSSQYQYEGQDYNYQTNRNDFRYQEDQNYQPDLQYTDPVPYNEQQYPTDSTYQQDQKYIQDSSYPQEQHYQQATDYQDQPHSQEINYRDENQFQDNLYQGSQPYDEYNTNQQGPDDFSESTSDSYQRSYQTGDTSDNLQGLEQYRNILGADSGSEPAYSEASEIENQMAAVLGQGGSSTTKMPEPVQRSAAPDSAPVTSSTPTPAPAPVSAPASAPTPASTSAPAPVASTTPTSAPTATSSPTPVSATRGKAGAKKKPQLTRKQSSISSDSHDSKSQAATPTLPKMSESASESSK